MLGIFRRWRRRRWRRAPFPPEWERTLNRDVPFYRDLTPQERKTLHYQVQVFCAEKYFFGSGGMEITDRVRVVIGAAAARLTLYLDISYYDRLTEIVVYPGDYLHPEERDTAQMGEAHEWGIVVLSWEAVLAGLRSPTDGENTAFHEFAHVLDRADGEFDGTPRLHRLDHYLPWVRAMDRHFRRLQQGSPALQSALDAYGATDETEFFAVATESFFERPRALKKAAPDLYREFVRFYRVDPAAR